MDTNLWSNTPVDIVRHILSQPGVDVNTRIEVGKITGDIIVKKLQVDSALVSKLKRIIQNHSPRTHQYLSSPVLYFTDNTDNIIQFPPINDITLTVNLTPRVPENYKQTILSDTTYVIQVKKRKCVIFYGYMLLDNGWFCSKCILPIEVPM